jgi:hypothetical protein
MTSRYLTPKTLHELCGPNGGFRCTICGLQREIIDGRPQLVLYVREDPRGIILTRKLYEDLTEQLGRSDVADQFFQTEGLQ